MSDLNARLTDLETTLDQYRAECARSQIELRAKLDRIMTAALGDHEMGVVGFVAQHRMQHEDLLGKVEVILAAQTESRTHRSQNAALPSEVAALRKEVADLQQTARDKEIETKAYFRVLGWVIVIINCAWGAGVALWKAFA